MQTLNQILEEKYKLMEADLKIVNINAERQYNEFPKVPGVPSLDGLSYYDIFENMKNIVKDPETSEYVITNIFAYLDACYLFSSGQDFMFKHKLRADNYQTVPIRNIIYPKLEKKVNSMFNDVSVMEQNPKKEENLSKIDQIMDVYLNFSMLLFLLYACDWQFPKWWKKIIFVNEEQLMEVLNTTNLTIGKFLHELVDYKIAMMKEVLDEISNLEIRNKFLTELTNLKEQHQQAINDFSHKDLSINYFLNHTFMEFLVDQSQSAPKTKQKIINPNNQNV